MREVTEAGVPADVAKTYPGVRKVTLDEANGVAYVFVGRGSKARSVRGPDFEALMKALSSTAADAGTATETESPPPAAVKVKRRKAAE